ncbi:putative alpha beta hydrolase [Phaeomoniella chlamydospora]|uniref:Putative alpha beta hydrolase n=1 Tax=Phaeomoniella chlamydospora TaxID=158046 RepID=A0A0G2GWB7_PHACM|nr:putative alpha beta hydrolase [Phaeomoniella chlamydospora]
MFLIYGSIAIYTGSFFRRESEKERLGLTVARDKIWNLSKPFDGFVHDFYVLQNGLRLHYVTNNPNNSGPPKPLIILIHGYPDSYSVWQFVMQSTILRQESTIVAVDLPGFGGSDSFPPYSATVILEALSEFIIGMREDYNVHYDTDSAKELTDTGMSQSKVFIVGHDWGCVLSYRLASEAPSLADRFILTNGPLPQLFQANRERTTAFAVNMFRAFFNAPIASRHCLTKGFRCLIPLVRQVYKIGYFFSFQLPSGLVRYLLRGGNRSFLRGIHQYATGENNSLLDQNTYLAGCLGPSSDDCKPQTAGDGKQKPKSYPASVVQRVMQDNCAYEATEYYRSGAWSDPWEKSLETIAALYDIEQSQGGSLSSRRHSSGALLFSEPYKGALKAPATIIWGQKDPVLMQQFCLDGIGDYLAKGSQVVMLPRTGHWTPSEVEGRKAVTRVIEWAILGEKDKELEEEIQKVYESSYVGLKEIEVRSVIHTFTAEEYED